MYGHLDQILSMSQQTIVDHMKISAQQLSKGTLPFQSMPPNAQNSNIGNFYYPANHLGPPFIAPDTVSHSFCLPEGPPPPQPIYLRQEEVKDKGVGVTAIGTGTGTGTGMGTGMGATGTATGIYIFIFIYIYIYIIYL